jgi:hypothetical protein
MLEGSDVLHVDGEPRVDGHPELSREEAEPKGVVRAADGPVVVEVEAGRDPGVGRGHESERVLDGCGVAVGDRQVVLLEESGGQRGATRSLGVEVELVDEQDVGPGALDDLGHGVGLVVPGGGQVTDQLSRGVAVERGVERGEPDGPGCVPSGPYRDHPHHQEERDGHADLHHTPPSQIHRDLL